VYLTRARIRIAQVIGREKEKGMKCFE